MSLMHREGAGGSTMSDLLNIIQVGDVIRGAKGLFILRQRIGGKLCLYLSEIDCRMCAC
jgi:hypothetical protein